MSLDAGSVYAILGGRFNSAGFKQFGNSLKQSVRSATAAEGEIVASQGRVAGAHEKTARTAQRLKYGAVAVAAGFAAIVYEGAKFEKAMRNVNSISGLNERQFKRLSASVNAMAKDTAQSPTKLAEGLYQLVSSGFKATESLSILKAGAMSASAGLTDTQTSITAIAGALNAYHLPASRAAQVSDILFQTVNRGVITFEQLAATIGLALPFANSLHIGLNQVGASLSTLTKEGIPAADATTYLKNSYKAFLSPSKGLTAAIKDTGYASGEALVKAKGYQGALEAVVGTTNGTKAAVAKLFPDIRALAGALALTGSNARTAHADIAGFASGATRGATSKVFEEQAKSAAFQWQRFKAELQSTAVVASNTLLPSLTRAMEGATKFLDDAQHHRGTGGLFDDIVKGAAKIASISWADMYNKGPKAFFDQIQGAMGFGSKKVDVAVNMSAALSAINRLNGAKLQRKALAIAVEDGDAKSKIRQLIRLGIPPKTAKMIASGVPEVQSQIDSLHGKTITIPVNYSAPGFSATPPSGKSGLGKSPPKHATGMKTSGPEVALIGEGNGPEWVIPSDPQYRGRAIGLLTDAMNTILPGYAKGTKKNGKGPSKKEQNRRQRVDQRIQDAGTQADTADTRMQTAQDANRRKAFERSKQTRLDALARERARIVAEMKRAKGSRRVSLQNQLARVDSDLATTRAKQYEAPAPLAAGASGTDLGANLRTMIDEWDAKLALAQLDTPLDTTDDLAALTGKREYLLRALAAVRADPARYGGASAITTVAGEIQSTAQAIKDLSAPAAITADQQAQADQQRQRGFLEGRTSSIDRLVGAATGSPVTVNFNALTASPKDARVAAETIIGGIGAQGGRQATTTRVGA